jgi:uracil DNA glycosylase
MKIRGGIWMKRNSGWKSIRESAECRDVLQKVDDLRKERKRIYPSETDVFRAFDDCPFEKVRVVILGQDPYANEAQAIGRAFAVSESTEIPPSLKNIFEKVRRDAGTNLGVVSQAGSVLAEHHPDGRAGPLQQPCQDWVERCSDHSNLEKVVR